VHFMIALMKNLKWFEFSVVPIFQLPCGICVPVVNDVHKLKNTLISNQNAKYQPKPKNVTLSLKMFDTLDFWCHKN